MEYTEDVVDRYNELVLNGSFDSLDEQEQDDLLYDVLNYYYDINDQEQILEYVIRLYKHRCNFLGKDHEDTIEILNDIGLAYYHLGEYKKALEYVNVCLYEEVLFDLHIENITNTLSNKATVFYQLGDIKKAIQFGELSYQLRLKELGIDNENTLVSLSNLGTYYAQAGNIEKAYECSLKAYETKRDLLGKDDPSTIDSYENMGERYNEKGMINDAFEVYSYVYDYRLSHDGLMDENTLNVLNKLAMQYKEIGNLHKATEMIEYCLEKTIEYMGESHMDTIDVYNNTAIVYSEIGRMEEAIEIVRRVYEIRKEVLGPTHQDTLDSLNNLSIYLNHAGKFDEALEKARECYLVLVREYGEDNYNTLAVIVNYTDCLFSVGHHQEAIELLEKYYRIALEILGVDSPITIMICDQLTIAYSNNKEYIKSLELSKECYDMVVNLYGPIHQDSARILSNLSSCYIDLEDYPTGLFLAEKAYLIQCQLLGVNHYNTLLTLGNIATIMSGTHQFLSSYSIAKVIYDLIKEDKTNQSENRLYTINTLAYVYQALGLFKEEIECLNEYFSYIQEDIDHLEVLDNDYLKNTLEMAIDNYQDYCEIIFTKELFSLDNYVNMVSYKNMIYYLELNSDHNLRMKLKQINYELTKYKVYEKEYQRLIHERDEILSLSHESSLFDTLGQFDLHDLDYQGSIIDIYDLKNNLYGVVIIDEKYHTTTLTLTKEEIGKVKEYINSNRVYVVVDGKLYDYPFDQDYHEVIYISSLNVLKKKHESITTNKPVIFTNANYNEVEIDQSRANMKRLIGTRIEELYLKDLLSDIEMYTDTAFNKSNLLNVDQPGFLHISTHGEYIQSNHFDLLQRPRLILSGYNTYRLGKNRAYVTAQEVYDHIDLTGCEFVFLDACLTGIGESISGEGLYGFRRVFEIKGCKYIIATLKEVSDSLAAIFSIVFYTHYKRCKDVEMAYFKTKQYLKDPNFYDEICTLYQQYIKLLLTNQEQKVRELNQMIEKLIYDSRINSSEDYDQELDIFILQKC